MKNILPFSIALIISTVSFAQNYMPLLQGNPVWKAYGIDNSQPSEESTTNVQYSLAGDTVIEALNYTKLNVVNTGTSYGYPFIEEAYLRENLETKQVFIRFKAEDQILFGGNEELLLYDFGLSEGDSFSLYEEFDGNVVSILSDTTYTIDGVERNAWRTDFPASGGGLTTRIYIEGIGFLSDLLMPVLYGEFNFYTPFTYCYSNSSEEILQEFEYPSVPESLNCSTVLSSRHTDISSALAIYPNPASTYFTVKLQDLSSIRVLNVVGAEVYFVNSINTDQMKLDNTSWHEGLYIVQVCNAQNLCGVRRLIINH